MSEEQRTKYKNKSFTTKLVFITFVCLND